MIVDSSALVAILLNEPDWLKLAKAMDNAPVRLLPAPTLLETWMVMSGRRGEAGPTALDNFLIASDVEIIPFTADHAAAARVAFQRYGKGRHPAALNFGDCIAYAAAKLENLPLLFKGDDFRQTDVEPAL